MKFCLVIVAFALVARPCRGRAVEESVVSDYTGAGAGSTPSVYSQIANNLAEKITQPFYRFLGISNSTSPRPFEHIELQDPETTTRDVEELSTVALTKIEKKPEKITLFNSYLPLHRASEKVASGKLESTLETFNQTMNEVDSEVDSDDFDDDFSLDEGEKPRGPFVYILELIGSVIQLLWGGFLAIFRPPTTSS